MRTELLVDHASQTLGQCTNDFRATAGAADRVCVAIVRHAAPSEGRVSRDLYADGAAAFVEGVARGIGYELDHYEPDAPAALRTHPERMIHEDQFDALIIEF